MERTKHLLRSIVFGLIALGFASCHQEQEIPTPSVPKAEAEVPFTNQRSEAQAKSIALDFLRQQGGQLRSLSSSLGFETSVVTRSSARALDALDTNSTVKPVDTLLYVLNIRGGQGCVLVGGDKRLTDIVGYIPEGHLDPNNLPKHSGISLFMDAYPKYYGARLRKPPHPSDPDPFDQFGRPKQGGNWIRQIEFSYASPDKGNWEEGITPLCPVTWHQDDPYNAKAPKINDQHTAAGCVAIATAQLMVTHKYPPTVDGKQMQWDLLRRYKILSDLETGLEKTDPKADSALIKTYTDQVSHLLVTIGNLLHNIWGTGGTGAYNKDIPGVLRKLGYTHAPNESDFNVNGIIASLKDGSPVIMGGASIIQGQSGHAWLCDGYMKRQITIRHGYDEYDYYGVRDPQDPARNPNEPVYTPIFIRRVYTSDTYETEYLLRYNWGWGSTCDGYFAPDVFAPDKEYFNPTPPEKATGYNFGRKVTNILNIKP